MKRKNLTKEEIREICDYREAGKNVPWIAAKMGCSVGSVSWHCLMNGANPPGFKLRPSAQPTKPVQRGRHVVKPFTPDEDKIITEMSVAGAKLAEISRKVGRRHNSISGRLATLARREELAEASA